MIIPRRPAHPAEGYWEALVSRESLCPYHHACHFYNDLDPSLPNVDTLRELFCFGEFRSCQIHRCYTVVRDAPRSLWPTGEDDRPV